MSLETLEEIKGRVEQALPGATITIVPNPGPANQPSLLIDNEHALGVASFLRDDPALRLDYCSNVTGVDWLDRKVSKKVKVKKTVEGEVTPQVPASILQKHEDCALFLDRKSASMLGQKR